MIHMSLEEAASHRKVRGQIFRDDGLDEFSIIETEFLDCEFVNCLFEGGRIGMSAFHSCRFTDCSFRDARLLSCQFNDAGGKHKCVWLRCDLSDATLIECDLSGNLLSSCRAFMLRLENCDASGALMEIEVHRQVSARQIMGGLSCHRTKLIEADLHELDLEGSTFDCCDLREADLSRCGLTSVNFVGSNLNGARLRGAILTDANIAHADIDDLALAEAASLERLVISPNQRDAVLAQFGIKVVP